MMKLLDIIQNRLNLARFLSELETEKELMNQTPTDLVRPCFSLKKT